MKFIALKTKDGSSKGNITFFCRVLHVSRQGYYQYLVMKDRPWKYQPLADAMKDILTEDSCNDTYGRTRMYQALTMKQPKMWIFPVNALFTVLWKRLGSVIIPDANRTGSQKRTGKPENQRIC